jgi:hypothetical protein
MQDTVRTGIQKVHYTVQTVGNIYLKMDNMLPVMMNPGYIAPHFRQSKEKVHM